MKSRFPSDVFENALNQIQVLEDAFWLKKSVVPSNSDTRDRLSRSGDTFQSYPEEASQGDSFVGQNSTQGHGQNAEDSQEEDVYEELDWKHYQGGCSMASVTLFAMNMVSVVT